MLCGYIVAIRLHTPWAYMVAIEAIFEDIRRKLQADVVRLPKADELNSLNLSSKPPLIIRDEYCLPTPGIPTMDAVGTQSPGLDATCSSSRVSLVSQRKYISNRFQSSDQTTEKSTVPSSNSGWFGQDLNSIPHQPTTNRTRLDCDQVALERNSSHHQSSNSILSLAKGLAFFSSPFSGSKRKNQNQKMASSSSDDENAPLLQSGQL